MKSLFQLFSGRQTPTATQRRAITLALAAVFLVVVSFAFGFSVGQKYSTFTGHFDNLQIPSIGNSNSSSNNNSSKAADFSLFQDVWNRVHSDYVGKQKLDDSALIYGAIKGMLGTLNDPYTLFFTPDETQNFLSEVNGKFDGIGAEVGMRNGKITVIAPLKDTPAEKSGLQAGDVILTIDSKDTSAMSLDEAVAKIRGAAGTKVTLQLQREGVQAPLTVSVVRKTIDVPSLRWEIQDNGIAVISFYEFSENAPRDFQNAANDILARHAKGIVLDLRNNPGGYLDAAVDVAGWLLPQQSLVVTEDFGNDQKTEHRTIGAGQLKDIPIIVLLNKGSASASEILAGALEDDRHVQIVGEQSFGKGSVQELDTLADNTSLKMTIAHWLTPSGKSIQGQGITPTIPVVMPTNPTADVQLQKAIGILQQAIETNGNPQS